MDMFNIWQGMGDAPDYGTPAPAPTSGGGDSRARAVADELARLELVCEAMWELVKEKTNLVDDDLLGKMAELDLADGVADGKKAKGGPVMCVKCNRPNSRRHDFCIYCGQHIRSKPFQ